MLDMKNKEEIIIEAFAANKEDFASYKIKATEALDSPIDDTYGTFNKICTNCLEREGHNRNYCTQCGQIMVKYDKSIHGGITNREWIERSAASWPRMGERIMAVLIRCTVDSWWYRYWNDYLDNNKITDEKQRNFYMKSTLISLYRMIEK